MFTGIVQTLGKVTQLNKGTQDTRITIMAEELDLAACSLGDSICVSGVCLTIIELNETSFSADISRETLSCTNLDELQEGCLVNLEKSLTLQQPIGGHLVSGHVDGLGTIKDFISEGQSTRFIIEFPQELSQFIAKKGSLCVDGVSLTVNHVENSTCQIQIIPHTLEKTLFHTYLPGKKVNLEVDLLARYVARILTVTHASTTSET